MKKFILILLALFLIPTKPIFAEAGLSEAMRAEYYRINNNYYFDVLPGGEGGEGKDYIGIYQYRKSTKRLGFCTPKYEVIPGGAKGPGVHASFDDDVYIVDNYIFDKNRILDVSNIKLIPKTVYSYPNETDTNKRLFTMLENIDSDPYYSPEITDNPKFTSLYQSLASNPDKILLTRDYINSHYQPLEIDPMSKFYCGIMIFMFGFVLTIIFSITLLVSFFEKLFRKQLTSKIVILYLFALYLWIIDHIISLFLSPLLGAGIDIRILNAMNLSISLYYLINNFKNIPKIPRLSIIISIIYILLTLGFSISSLID